MNRYILIAAVAACASVGISAQEIVEGVSIGDLNLEHNGSYMTVDMTMDLSRLKIKGNKAVLLTPRLVNGSDSLDLAPVGVYSRRRYYYYVRNGKSMLGGADERSFKESDKPSSLSYNQVLPYQEWMNGAELMLSRSDFGCCNTLLAQQSGVLGDFREAVKFFPELVYVRPKAELVKNRSIEGSAFIDFPVNQTTIDADYRRNATELAKIQGSIDSVRGDSDVQLTQVWLKGYASPEGPYDSNVRLAKGRTAALDAYIRQLYHFGDGIIVTDYEPEDWTGFRKYVEATNLAHKNEILSVIDGGLEPDAKNWKIKSTYPEEYNFLLENCYPALRQTDYRIAYRIRVYHDVEEIERVLKSQPQKLSQNEFYLVAQKYEPGTDEFTEVFEIAVHMFPDDETANLNAANAAMRCGDNLKAEKYLAKSGDSAEAVYARGAFAIRTGDYDSARKYLEEAKSMGLEQAGITLTELGKKIN